MTISVGMTLFLGNIGAQVGVLDGSIGLSISSESGDNLGVVTGTIQTISAAAGLVPGPIGGLASAVAVGVTVGKVGGTDKISWGDVLGIIGGVAGIVAAAAASPGVVALGTVISFGAGIASLTYTFSDIPSLSAGRTAAVSSSIGTTPDPLVKTIHYVDPLIFDLDGDGLEIMPLANGVLFDTNGDLIKTGTAWVGADDGLLVWDRNGNGQIDTGAELFGDETILANGQKATHGFTALRELDKGSVINGQTVGAGDGVFDVKDAQYANLRIWRDLNQDGISQAGELRTLAETGVQSIKLASATTSKNYADAVLVQESSFTRSNGSTGEVGSFILAQNNFIRSFTPITVNAAAQALPALQGSGMVRDLQEAATLNPELIGLVSQAKDAATRAGFKSAVATLMREWGNDSPYNSASEQALANGYGLILSEPLDTQERGWMDMAVKSTDASRDSFRATLTAVDRTKFDAMRERMVGGLEKIHSYEAFTGYTFLSWSQIYADAAQYQPRYVSSGRVAVEVNVPLTQLIYENRNGVMSSQAGYVVLSIPQPVNGVPHFESLWSRLVDDATNNLMPALRLSKYLDMVDLNLSGAGVVFDFSRLNASFAAASASNKIEGAALLVDMYRFYGSMLNGIGWNGDSQLFALMQQGLTDNDIRSVFDATNYTLYSSNSVTGSIGNDTFSGDAAANTFSSGFGNDVLDGQAGNDALYGEFGDDLIFGRTGNDMLYGGDGNDTLNGGADSDSLYGEAGADTLDGGAGNDYLSGDAGNDVYLFGRGSGADTVSDYDSTVGNADLISISSGVATDQLWFRRIGGDLEVSVIGTSDKTTISSWYSGGTYHVEQFKTADGKTLLDSRVEALVSAMASFTPPALGQTTLPPSYQSSLNPVIAANWQ